MSENLGDLRSLVGEWIGARRATKRLMKKAQDAERQRLEAIEVQHEIEGKLRERSDKGDTTEVLFATEDGLCVSVGKDGSIVELNTIQVESVYPAFIR